MNPNKPIFYKHYGHRKLFEIFIISTVVTIIVTRLFLIATDYFTLSYRNIHIAHLLWGGFLMAGANILLLSSLTHLSRKICALIGGIGFGLFIDEIGKFVTANNNYFHYATFSLIYGVILAYIIFFRRLHKSKIHSNDEDKLNYIELTKESLMYELDETESAMKDALEKKSKLHLTLESSEVKAHGRFIGSIFNYENSLRKFFIKERNRKYALFFGSLATVITSVWSLWETAKSVLNFYYSYDSSFEFWDLNRSLVSDSLEFTFASIAVYFAILSIMNFRKKAQLTILKTSIFTSIFFVRIFGFYRNPIQTTIFVTLDVLTLLICEYLEKFSRSEKSV